MFTDMNNVTKYAIAGVMGGGFGFLLGVIIADALYPEYFTDEEHRDLEEFAAIYQKKQDEVKIVKTISGMAVKPELAELKTDYAKIYGDPDDISELAVKIRQNADVETDIFDDFEPDREAYDLSSTTAEEYIGYRDESVPFVITKDEFEENVLDNKQVSLFLFSDGVLLDEQYKPLLNERRVVGSTSMSNFGVFSDDPNVVYVRNPELKVDYKVIQLKNTYEDSFAPKPTKPRKRKVVKEVDESSE